MSDVNAYAGSFIVGQPSEITFNDPDDDGDLEGYTEITVTYTPLGGSPIPWEVVEIIPIYTDTDEVDPRTGASKQVVNTVVILVIPAVPLPGCLGRFLPSFLKPGRVWKPGPAGGSGTLTGTLNPPTSGVVVAGGPTKPTKTFNVDNPRIFFGTLA